MNANYVIVTEDGYYFGGWSRLGVMCMKSPKEKGLAYRMSRTVATNNLGKVESFCHKTCKVIPA